jgi:hypothetical protein
MLHGPYAHLSILRPHDRDTVDFEAGVHPTPRLQRQAKDTWVWYGWTAMCFGLSPARQ